MAASREQIEALIASLEQQGPAHLAAFLGQQAYSNLQGSAVRRPDQNVFALIRANPTRFADLVEQIKPGYFQRQKTDTVANGGTIDLHNPFAPPAAQTSQNIAHYKLGPELGRGAMGVVYKAHDTKHDRPVALKMIIAPDLEAMLRFDEEVKNLARVNHPNILQVYDSGKNHLNQKYLVTEFVEGGQTLSNLLPNLPLAQDRYLLTARIFKQIAEGLGHAHERKILHRDMKPANVLVTPDKTPKVSDFGLAKNTQKPSGLTHDGDIIGTPQYMSPEQINGLNSEMGPQSDVYSLGVMLYQALTGLVPFDGRQGFPALAKDITHTKPASPRVFEKTIPKTLETITLKAMSKKKEDRYSDGNEFAEALGEYIDQETGRRIRTKVAKRGSAIGAVVLGLLGTFAGVQSYRAQGLELDKLGAEKKARDAELTLAQTELKLATAERATKQERSQTYVTEMRAMIAQERYNDAGRLYALALDNSTERAALETTLREDKRKIDGIMNVTIDASAGGEWNVDKIFPDRFERVHPAGTATERQTRTIQVPRGTSYVLEANGYRQPFRVAGDMTIRVRTPENLEGFVFVPATRAGEQDIYFTRWPINRITYSRDETGNGARPITDITPEDATRFAETYQRQLRRQTGDDRWTVRLPTVDEFVHALAPESGRPYPSGATLPQGRAIPGPVIRATPLEQLLVPTNISYTDPRFAVAATGLHLSNCSEFATRDGKTYAVMSDFSEQDPRLYGFIAPVNGPQNDPIVMREISNRGHSPLVGFRLVAYKQP